MLIRKTASHISRNGLLIHNEINLYESPIDLRFPYHFETVEAVATLVSLYTFNLRGLTFCVNTSNFQLIWQSLVKRFPNRLPLVLEKSRTAERFHSFLQYCMMRTSTGGEPSV